MLRPDRTHGAARDGRTALRAGDDGLVVEGQGHFVDDIAPVGLTELSQVILSALVDEHDLGPGPQGPEFRLVKRHKDKPARAGG